MTVPATVPDAPLASFFHAVRAPLLDVVDALPALNQNLRPVMLASEKTGVAEALTALGGPRPYALYAVSVNVYAVPFVSPVATTGDVDPSVCAACATPAMYGVAMYPATAVDVSGVNASDTLALPAVGVGAPTCPGMPDTNRNGAASAISWFSRATGTAARRGTRCGTAA